MSTVLDVTTQPLDTGFLVEASAGTGKTYSVAALVTRLIAESDTVRIGNILITTFTRNAAAELRDRVRRRLAETASALARPPAEDEDEVLVLLRAGTPDEIAARIMRLRRASVEFDTATIATIHSVLSKILSLAGRPIAPSDDQDRSTRIIEEVVNDELLNEAAAGFQWDQERVRLLVQAKLGEPLTELWFEPGILPDTSILDRAKDLVMRCVAGINERNKEYPSFDDLMRDAHQVVTDPANSALVSEFQGRYLLAMVDESQDTDALQWELFNALFPMNGDGALVAVGDPKQSIYKFRGADVDAYAAQKSSMPVVTLTTNFRSDQPLVDAFNVLFEGFTFGPSVAYEKVRASQKNQGSQISGVKPFETVDFGSVNDAISLARATARRVMHLLATARLNGNPVDPRQIAVLVRTGANGLLIERELRRWSVPVVSAGTASVMDSEMAAHVRVLLQAMERVSNVGRARLLATTHFIDASITDPRIVDDDFVTAIQDKVSGWVDTLRQDGVAGLMTSFVNDADVISRIMSGPSGLHHLTDLSHVFELLDDHSRDVGASPEALLQVFDELGSMDKTSELVARRVENDLNAVQIMTMHVSKGLQFPVVVVADTWTAPSYRHQPKIARIDDNGVSRRVIDLCFVLPGLTSQKVADAHVEAEMDESRRLFYVAITRAEHHATLMLAPHDSKRLPTVICGPSGDAVNAATTKLPVVKVDSLSRPAHYDASTGGVDTSLTVADMDKVVVQTYRRTSFTTIANVRDGLVGSSFAPPGSGADEATSAVHALSYAPATVPTGVAMPLARVPGGVHLGKVMHKVYETVDFAARDMRAEVSSSVARHVTGQSLSPHRRAIEEAVLLSLSTPLGPSMNDRTLETFGRTDRLAEMDFEMGLESLTKGVKVSDIGRVLVKALPGTDALAPYARVLSDSSFDVPLAGLINGSIDALLRIHTDEGPRLFITDYKTNRLDREGDQTLIDAYAPVRLVSAMEHHHYPLQALIYGTAVHRWLKWRAPHLDADVAVAGVAYFFVRGMVGPDTPRDDGGNPHGVFAWTPPAGLWSALSDAMAGGSR